MSKRILVMGLPGAGKTTLAEKIVDLIQTDGKTITWLNADDVRKKFNDWDFSPEGRIRQSIRMRELADASGTDYAICDFVAPLTEMRNNFKADWVIWVDTIREGRYADTNKMFVEPEVYDFRINEQNAEKWSEFITHYILLDQRRPVFEIRDVQGWQGSNPFAIEQVNTFIKRDLDPLYQGQYQIQVVPNIIHIGWGRGVGYTAGEETFDENITSISATKIRRSLGIG